MNELRAFRKANNLTQDELSEYLHMTSSHISMVENGKARLQREKYALLINNDRGWDTSMLKQEEEIYEDNQPADKNYMELRALRKEAALLREQMEELRKEKERYWQLIQTLTSK